MLEEVKSTLGGGQGAPTRERKQQLGVNPLSMWLYYLLSLKLYVLMWKFLKFTCSKLPLRECVCVCVYADSNTCLDLCNCYHSQDTERFHHPLKLPL